MYASRTVDPVPLINTETFRDTRLQTPTLSSVKLDMTVGGVYQEMHYQPAAGGSAFRLAWEGKKRDGTTVQSGSYPFEATVTNNYRGLRYAVTNRFGDSAVRPIPGPTTLEPVPISSTFPGRLRVINRSTSPLGIGWGIDEVSKLHLDPDGPILIEHGNGSSSTFRPTQIIYATFVGNVGEDYGIAVVDTGTNQELSRIPFARAPDGTALPIAMARSADETKAYVSRGAIVSVLSPPGHNLQDLAVNRYVGFRSPALRLAATPDGRKLFVGATALSIDGHGPEFTLLDLSTNQFQVVRAQDTTLKFRDIAAVVVSPDNQFGYALLAGATSSAVQSLVVKINLVTGASTVISLPLPNQGPNMKMDLSPDGQVLAITGDSLLLLDASTLAIVGSIPGTYRDVVFNRSNSKILAASLSGLFIYDLAESAGVTAATDGDIKGLAIAPDDRRVFFTGPFTQQPTDSQNPAFNRVLHYVDLITNAVEIPVPRLHTNAFTTAAPATIVEDRGRFTPGRGDFTTLIKNPDGTYVRLYPHGGEIHFNARGLQTALIEPNGRRRTYTHDAQDRLISIQYPGDEGTATLNYGAAGLESVVGRNGRTTHFEMSSGKLTAIVDAAGGRQGYAYDDVGRMTKKINKLGGETAYTYGALGTIAGIKDGGGTQQSVTSQSVLGLINFVPAGQGGASTPITAPAPQLIKGSFTTRQGGFMAVQSNAFGKPKEIARPDGGVTKNTFDLQSLPKVTIDPFSRTTTFAHTPNGVPTTIKYPDGSSQLAAVHTVGSATVVNSIRQPTGGLTGLTYTSARQIASVTNPRQKTTGYGYTGTSVVSRIESPSLRTTQIDPTPFGAPSQIKIFRASAPAGGGAGGGDPGSGGGAGGGIPGGAGGGDAPATWDLGYDARRNPISVRDPAGHTTTMGYDAMGRRTSVTNPLGHTSQTSYDLAGHPTLKVDELGNRTTFSWNDQLNLSAITNALSQTTQLTYTLAHQLETVTTFRGETTRYAYDTLGRLITTTDPLDRATVRTWDKASQLVEVLAPGNRRTTMTYDNRGRVQVVSQPDQNQVQYGYDADGKVTSITDPSLRVQRYERDAAGLVSAIVDPENGRQTYTYDDDGRVETVTDQVGNKTTFTYDTQGRVETIKFHDGDVYRTTYDARGLLTKVTSALNGVWEYTYDAARRLVSKKDPLGNVCSYGYNPAGLMTRIDEPAEGGARIVTTKDYDPLNRVSRITTPDRTLTYTYLDLQRTQRIDISPGGTTIERANDAAGRLIRESITGPGGTRTVEYKWGVADTLDQVKQNGELVLSYEYDAMNRVTKIRDERNGREHKLGYSPSGELTLIEYPSGLKKTQTWGSRGELKTLRYLTAAGNAVLTRSYTYDAKLRLKDIADEAGLLARYQYDSRDRLTRADYSDGTFEKWKYDANSNITAYDTGSSADERRYDLADQLIEITSTASSDGTTATTTTVLLHDPRGNLVRRTSGSDIEELSWDAENRLRRVGRNGQQVMAASYLEDYRLDQLEESSQSTSFSWFGPNPLSEYVGGVEAVFNVALFGMDETIERGPPRSGRRALLTDHLGSAIGYFDDAGAASEFTFYAAFGKVRRGPDPSGVGFTGARQVQGTKLVYLRNRWLDTDTGRFTSRDPIDTAMKPNPGGLRVDADTDDGTASVSSLIGVESDLGEMPDPPEVEGGWNTYAYVDNNPINWSDEEGLARGARPWRPWRIPWRLPPNPGGTRGARDHRQQVEREANFARRRFPEPEWEVVQEGRLPERYNSTRRPDVQIRNRRTGEVRIIEVERNPSGSYHRRRLEEYFRLEIPVKTVPIMRIVPPPQMGPVPLCPTGTISGY